MGAESEPPRSGHEAGNGVRLARVGRALRGVDRNETVLRVVHAARRAAPGGDELAAPSGRAATDRLARLIERAGAEEASATREVGLAAIQLWQALSRSRNAHPVDAELAVVLTDLVDFSDWALQAGDDQVLQLLRDVGRANERAITRHGGTVVKSLGDGLMAVFRDPAAAIEAATEACTAVSAVMLNGYRPQLRAGVHVGQPRRVGQDYLGVDVNIAARVADAASSGEVLASTTTLAVVDISCYAVGRRRKLRAKGAPKGLGVQSVVPVYNGNR